MEGGLGSWWVPGGRIKAAGLSNKAFLLVGLGGNQGNWLKPVVVILGIIGGKGGLALTNKEGIKAFKNWGPVQGIALLNFWEVGSILTNWGKIKEEDPGFSLWKWCPFWGSPRIGAWLRKGARLANLVLPSTFGI